MLAELFHKCAYDIHYEQVGDSVNYAFEEIDNSLYIYFQGSNSITDWVRNFLFTTKVYKMFRVHRGFYAAYSEVRNIILDKAYSKDYDEIVVVGYSHGGALTYLAIEDLNYHFPDKRIRGYAFEAPRCLKVRRKYRHLWGNLIVTRDGTDIVTHVPPRLFGYRHLGKMIKFKGDASLVEGCMLKCVKYHYPQVVYDGLKKYENFEF